MFRFTIRDVLWLTAVVAMALGWFTSYRLTKREREKPIPERPIVWNSLLPSIDPTLQSLNGKWRAVQAGTELELRFESGPWVDPVDDRIAVMTFKESWGQGFVSANAYLDHTMKEIIFYPRSSFCPTNYSHKHGARAEGRARLISETLIEIDTPLYRPDQGWALRTVFIKQPDGETDE